MERVVASSKVSRLTLLSLFKSTLFQEQQQQNLNPSLSTLLFHHAKPTPTLTATMKSARIAALGVIMTKFHGASMAALMKSSGWTVGELTELWVFECAADLVHFAVKNVSGAVTLDGLLAAGVACAGKCDSYTGLRYLMEGITNSADKETIAASLRIHFVAIARKIKGVTFTPGVSSSGTRDAFHVASDIVRPAKKVKTEPPQR